MQGFIAALHLKAEIRHAVFVAFFETKPVDFKGMGDIKEGPILLLPAGSTSGFGKKKKTHQNNM